MVYVALSLTKGLPGGSVEKNLPAKQGTAGDSGSSLIPGSGRSPGERNGNPLQYSYLENPMDRGTWPAPIHDIAESMILQSQTRLSD